MRYALNTLICCSFLIVASGQPVLLVDLNPGPSNSNPSRLTAFDNKLYWNATDGSSGLSLFASNGTPGSAELVFTAPMISGINNGPTRMTSFQNHLVFHHFDGNQTHIYLSDGTAGGTYIASDPSSGTASWLSSPVADFGYHYFTGAPARFYRLDANTLTPVLLTGPDHPNGINANLAFHFQSCGNRAYFSGFDNSAGHEPFVTDGTHEGTYRIADMNPGFANSWPQHFTCFGDSVMFTAQEPGQQRALYKSNGTAQGTVLIKEINSGANAFSSLASNANFFKLNGGAYLFVANDGIHGHELWRTDGTETGTYMVKDIRPGTQGSVDWQFDFELFYPVGDGSQAIFYANDGTHGTEWYITDGTDQGTQLLIDLQPGSQSGSTTSMYALDGKVYFAGRAPGANRELFVTDGTVAGTSQLSSINPGANAQVTNITSVGSRLFFRATNSQYGAEIWTVDLTTLDVVNASNPEPLRVYPNPAYDYVYTELIEALGGVFRVYDSMGRLCLSEPIDEYRQQVNISALAPGYYIAAVEFPSGKITKTKLVVQ